MRDFLYPIGTVILAVLLWYGAVLLFKVPPYLLPLPHMVIQRIIEDFPFLMRHSAFTTYVTLGGFLLSVAVGIPLAFLIVSSSLIDKAIMPWLILSQTFPKVAL